MLEEGKIYLVKTTSNYRWLFKKELTCFDMITSCRMGMCLKSDYYSVDAQYICTDNAIVDICLANENQIAMWNKTFNDNVELQ